MARKQKIEMCEGDTLPILQFEYEGLTIVDWSFRFNVSLNGSVLTKIGTIIDPHCGLFQFKFDAGDLPVGEWDAELETTDHNGEVLTLKDFCITVRSQIA